MQPMRHGSFFEDTLLEVGWTNLEEELNPIQAMSH